MAIPGYDPEDLENVVALADESAGVRVDVVAGVVPDAFDLAASEREAPPDAVSARAELSGVGELAGVETFRIALSYDPAALPADVRPNDVAIVAETAGGRRHLSTTVDRESAVVSAELSQEPLGDAFVAVPDER